jgi:hypothetical protein
MGLQRLVEGRGTGMIRLLHFLVQPVLVEDDGESLTAVRSNIPPQALGLSAMKTLVETWPEQLAALSAEITQPATVDPS